MGHRPSVPALIVLYSLPYTLCSLLYALCPVPAVMSVSTLGAGGHTSLRVPRDRTTGPVSRVPPRTPLFPTLSLHHAVTSLLLLAV